MQVQHGTWKRVYHPDKAMGPYAFSGNQWVGYDDVATVRRKSEFVMEKGYGGAMIWALDLDDFNNVCGCEKYPLLKTINRVLRNYGGKGMPSFIDGRGRSDRPEFLVGSCRWCLIRVGEYLRYSQGWGRYF